MERARVKLLVDGFTETFGDSDFYWIASHPKWRRGMAPEDVEYVAGGLEFLKTLDGMSDIRVLRGRGLNTFTSGFKVRRAIKPGGRVLAIGTSALPYGRLVRPKTLIWCVNGIPEERDYNLSGFKSRILTAASWQMARFGRTPDLCVTVSNRMSDHISEKAHMKTRFVAVPTSADVPVAKDEPVGQERKYLIYAGSGAAWQNLPGLNVLWQNIWKLDSTVQFLVVSKDDRAKVLGQGIPDDNITFTSAQNGAEVREYLQTGLAGFAIREPHIVNRASYPTKIGEYLAAGVPVVTSDIDWDPGDLLRDTKAGLLISGDPTTPDAASAVLELINAVKANPDEYSRASREMGDNVSIAVWKRVLRESYRSIADEIEGQQAVSSPQ